MRKQIQKLFVPLCWEEELSEMLLTGKTKKKRTERKKEANTPEGQESLKLF